MLISYWHKMAYKKFHCMLFNQAIWGKHWEEDVCLQAFALQTKSSNCLVLIPLGQLGNYLLGPGRSYGLPAQHICKTLQKTVFNPYQQIPYSLKTHNSMLLRILVPICGSNICLKIVPSWSRNSGPGTCLQDGHLGKHQPPKLQHPDSSKRHMCHSKTSNFPYRRKILFWYTLACVTYY